MLGFAAAAELLLRSKANLESRIMLTPGPLDSSCQVHNNKVLLSAISVKELAF